MDNALGSVNDAMLARRQATDRLKLSDNPEPWTLVFRHDHASVGRRCDLTKSEDGAVRNGIVGLC